MNRVLVTGADGFVGQASCRALHVAGYEVKGIVRKRASCVHRDLRCIHYDSVEDIGPNTKWNQMLEGIDTIIHLAARVHIMQETASDPILAFRYVNVLGTEKLARAAARSGVRRFVFVSSIKVNGEGTRECPFVESDVPKPEDPYAISKSEAEECLRRIHSETGMEAVIVRPPLVYGPGVKGNFLQLLRWVSSQIPLPFGSVDNRRSFVGLGNLADFLVTCVNHPAAGGETFLVSDMEDLSTPGLIHRIGRALQRPAHLLPFPVPILRLGALILRKEREFDRLCGSLVVNCQKALRVLNWSPPYSVDQGLTETATWYSKS